MASLKRRSSPFNRFFSKRYNLAEWNCNDYVCFFAEKYRDRNTYPYAPEYGKESKHMKALMTFCRNRKLSLYYFIAWLFQSVQESIPVRGLRIKDITFDRLKRYASIANRWANEVAGKCSTST